MWEVAGPIIATCCWRYSLFDAIAPPEHPAGLSQSVVAESFGPGPASHAVIAACAGRATSMSGRASACRGGEQQQLTRLVVADRQSAEPLADVGRQSRRRA